MTFLSDRATQTISPERIDRNRHRTPILFGIIGIICASLATLMCWSGSTVTAFSTIYISFVIFDYAFLSWRIRPLIAQGRKHWHYSKQKVNMTCPSETLIFEFSISLLGALGAPLAVITWLIHPPGDWIGTAGLAAFASASSPYWMPIIRAGGPTRHRITLTRNGIELTQIDGRTNKIRWQDHPTLIGVRQGDAIITLKNHHELHYPIAYLPMSMRQLERLLKTLSTNKQLRTSLSGPDALSTVLTILEPTNEELTDGSCTWSRRTQPHR